jgi:HD-like signal output (HDOD) protein
MTCSAGKPPCHLSNVTEWIGVLRDADIPVLAQSAARLEELRSTEDAVDANTIGEAFGADPLMTLKILAYASTHRAPRLITETETVTSTLVMMGIGPFFRAFGHQTTVEERLRAEPEALRGLMDTIHRTHRASLFALSFAVHRREGDAAIIHLAALLHDFAEMLLWCHVPDLALQIQRSQLADTTLRSATAQRAALHLELGELQQGLMKAWRLPELLIRISDSGHAEHSSVRCVLLAMRLARHTTAGWDNPAVLDDLADIGQLLNISLPATLDFVRAIDQ